MSPLPPDDPRRELAVVDDADPTRPRIGMVGDTYTVLLSGAETNGQYCLIDMRVPHCGGPGPHRHDFEEMFRILEGEIEFTFRGVKRRVHAGMTVNIPANAPHFFTNVSGQQARMLCMCTPAGQEEFFAKVGKKLAPGEEGKPLGEEEQKAFIARAEELAPQYRTEMLPPPGK